MVLDTDANLAQENKRCSFQNGEYNIPEGYTDTVFPKKTTLSVNSKLTELRQSDRLGCCFIQEQPINNTTQSGVDESLTGKNM